MRRRERRVGGEVIRKGEKDRGEEGRKEKGSKDKGIGRTEEGRIVVKERGRKWEKLVRGRRKDATPYEKRR